MDEYVDLTGPKKDHGDHRAARRSYAAWELASSLNVIEALLSGRPVPRELLNEPYRTELSVWGGFLDDPTALDVALIAERRHAAGTPAEPAEVVAAPPAQPATVSLRDLGVLDLAVTRPAKRRRAS